MDLWKRSATALAELIASREVSSVEVIESVLERVDATNPKLNAITYSLADDARAAAFEADQAVANGEPLGPLHGVPVTIKENVDQAGHSTPNGLPILANLTASEDSPLVTNLKSAGAIVIGRTNTPEFSMRGTTDNPLRGRTYNPWDDETSPGGSSGGAGAACAAGMGPIHHGNDIGGSLRFPSFANGVTTIKPSSFRVPTYNSTWAANRPLLSTIMSCQGIIARHARDVRVTTQAMIAPHPLDPHHVPLPWDGPDAPERIAFTAESADYPIHDGIVALLYRAADQLRDAGYVVEEVTTPSMSAAASEWFRAGSTEMQHSLAPAIEQYGSADIQNVFDSYFELSELLDLQGYISAMGDRSSCLLYTSPSPRRPY